MGQNGEFGQDDNTIEGWMRVVVRVPGRTIATLAWIGIVLTSHKSLLNGSLETLNTL